MMRHSLRRKPDGEGYHVGYYDLAAMGWKTVGEVDTLDEAIAWAAYLNGGDKPTGSIRDRHDA
jgi:hypothetical protein